MSENLLSLEGQLCFAVYAASHAFTKTYKPLLAGLGITYPQYLVMLFLWEKRVATVTEIATALGLDSGTLSPLLKRLEKTAFIRRERSREDERQVAIHLTALGAAKQEEASRIVMAIGAATGCSLDEMVDVRNRLNAIRARLEKAAA